MLHLLRLDRRVGQSPAVLAIVSITAEGSSFARNSAFGVVAGLLSTLANFASTVIVARILGVEGTGAVAFAMWIVATSAIVADLGVSATLARFLPELTSRGQAGQACALAAFCLRPLVIAALLAGFGFVLYGLLVGLGSDAGQNGTVWFLIALCCAAQTGTGYMQGYLRGLQRFDLIARMAATATLLQLAIITAGSLAFGVTGALLGYSCGAMILPLLGIPLLPRTDALDREVRQRSIRYAAYIWGSAVAATFAWSRVELFFLQRFWGDAAVGLFTVGLTLSSLAIQGPVLLTAGLLPYFSQHFGGNRIAVLRDASATGTRLMALLVFPMCAGTAAIMPRLLPLIYGPAFSDAVPTAELLVAMAGFGAVSAVGSNVVNAMERADFMFISGIIGVFLSVLCGLTIIPAFGPFGAACARAGIQTCLIGFGSWFITRRLSCPIPFADLGRLLVAAVCSAVAARLCLFLIPGPVALFVAIPTDILVYMAAVRTIARVPSRDVERLRSVMNALPWRLGDFASPLLWVIAKS